MAVAAVQLRLRRKERGWTLEDVVDRLHSVAREMGEPVPGVDRQAVSRWERGTHRPRAHYVRLLSTLYQASPLDLGLVDQVEEQASVTYEPACRPGFAAPFDDDPRAQRQVGCGRG